MESIVVEVPVEEEKDSSLEEFMPLHDLSTVESSIDTEKEAQTQIELSPIEETKEITEELPLFDNETYDPEFEPKDAERIVLPKRTETVLKPVESQPVNKPEPQTIEEPVLEEKPVEEKASFVIQESKKEATIEENPAVEEPVLENAPINTEEISFDKNSELVPNPYFRSKKMLPKKKSILLYSSAVLIFLCLIVSIFVVIYVYK